MSTTPPPAPTCRLRTSGIAFKPADERDLQRALPSAFSPLDPVLQQTLHVEELFSGNALTRRRVVSCAAAGRAGQRRWQSRRALPVSLMSPPGSVELGPRVKEAGPSGVNALLSMTSSSGNARPASFRSCAVTRSIAGCARWVPLAMPDFARSRLAEFLERDPRAERSRKKPRARLPLQSRRHRAVT
mgnify:CR=1 FL=1